MPPADPLTDAPVRAAGGLVLLAGVVATVSGAVLAVAYRPDDLRWLRTLHAGSAAIAVVTAIAARVVARGGRLKVSGRTVGFVAAAVVVLGGAFATGSLLAWDEAGPGDRGMFLGGGHRIVIDGDLVSSGGLAVSFVLHTLLGLGAFVLMAWPALRARRQAPS